MGKDQEFLEAARNGNVVAVEKLLNSKAKRGGPLASLRRGPGSNVQDSSGYSALHHAALNGHREIVVLLLEHEASPNIVDSKGSSPLHLAAWAGHSDIVRLLLTTSVHVIQINLKNKDDETALHCAAQYGHTGVVSLLLKHGANPSFRNVRDETALDLAAQYGRLETVELLLQTHPELIHLYEYQASQALKACQRRKTSPIHAASRNGHRAVVDALLAAGFPVNMLTLTGTALHEAALCGKVDVVRRLLDAGIDVSLKDSRGFSALRIVQDLPTPIAQEIATLIQNGALSAEINGDDSSICSPGVGGMPFRFPTATCFTPGSPYENVSISSSCRGDNYERESRKSASSCASTGADSFITLPRRRHKAASTSSYHSQRSDGGNSVYEIPPPPRSLPWLQRNHDVDGDKEKRSSSQSDLLDDDSAFVGGPNDDYMSRSYDGRSLDFLSLSDTQSTVANDDANDHRNRSAFKRSSHARHSADQYLPMTASSTTKVSPNPPQKPPRKLQGMSAHYESLPRSAGRQKTRQTSCCYSVETRPQSQSASSPSHRNKQQQPYQKSLSCTSSTGYELVYLARTGSRAEAVASETSHSPRFRVQKNPNAYVEMASREPSTYENVELQNTTSTTSINSPIASTVDDDSIYDIPRELGGSKAYENVSFHGSDPMPATSSSASAATTTTSPSKSTTPESPSRLPNMPPTPDHPPPPAHLAEQSIHLRIRPLSEELKRKSRDMETETEEEFFVALSNGCDAACGSSSNSSSNGGSISVSLSVSEKSLSTDNIDEVVIGDQPYEGLLRGSVPGSRSSSMDRPNSLNTSSSGQSRSWNNDKTSSTGNGSHGGNRPNRTSLSVLSPFDEKEEWTKILEILNSCNNDLRSTESGNESDDSHLLGAVQREFQNRLDAMGRAPVESKKEDIIEVPISSSYDTIADWLLSLGMQQYLSLFVTNGFNDIDFLGDGILDDSSLLEVGVLDSEHRNQLVKAASLLKTPLYKMNSVAAPETIAQWLHLLRLDHYTEQFHKNRYDDMERVRRIWKDELTAVVEIQLVGHVRRILVSLDNGVKPHPPKMCNGTDSSIISHQPNPQQHHGDLVSLSSDLEIIQSTLARLEDEISQKMIETMGNARLTSSNRSYSTTTLGRKKSRPAPQPPSTLPIPKSDDSLERVLEDIHVRNPSDLVMGIAKTVATHWRHEPQNLLPPGIYYEAQYLGSTLVRHVRGTESTKRSIQKLKKKQAEEGGNRTASIILAISLSGVQFLDPLNQDTICKHDIRNINCACQDADDLTHFAYITKDQESSTQDHFCHVFRVHTMDLATEVILTLGQAFEVAYQLVLRQESYSPCNGDSSQEPSQANCPSQPTNNVPLLLSPTSVTMAPVPYKPATNRTHSSVSAPVPVTAPVPTSVPATVPAPVPAHVKPTAAPRTQIPVEQPTSNETTVRTTATVPSVTTIPTATTAASTTITTGTTTAAATTTTIASVANNKLAGGRPAADPARKIGPKPTVLPKPKLGTALFGQRSGSNTISHARSHSSVDGLPASCGAGSAMEGTRLHSESNLASLQASNRPTNSSIKSHPSSASIASTGSGRAPLAAKDEL